MSDVNLSSSFDSSDAGSGGKFFLAAIALVVILGVAAVAVAASGRESNIGVAPEAAIDHWHSVYSVNNCGVDMPATQEFEDPGGTHTHGDGLLHIHPFNPSASGRNSTLGNYFEASGAELTDSSFIGGPADIVPIEMTEEAGCDGEPATLQLAVWRNAFDETAEPEIITENLADFRFETAGMAITLALLPDGETPPKPPAERMAALGPEGVGGPIFGVEEGESPVVTLPVEDDAEVGDAEVNPDAESTEAEADGTEVDAGTSETETSEAGTDDAETSEG